MGPAGIGKSRLAWEFSKYSDGLVEDTYWHTGRSPSYGEGITFWALGEMVRRRCGLAETEDDASTHRKVAETVQRWVPEKDEKRWIETALLALLGLGEPLPGGRDELYAAWRTFFERIAAHGTTVLLFEDLHWADSGLLDFIDHVLDWTKSLPIFILTLSRPELLERRPGWGSGRRNFVSLALEPLSEPAMRELLDGLVPGLPAELAATIVARADGIPLYAVETVRMLVAEGRLVEQAGVYRPLDDLRTIAIPETLGALIAARLDGLDAAERTALQDAAVLGQSFSVAALGAVSGIDPKRLTPLLAGFVRRELLTINADPRSPERGHYTFMQALIREVAYNQLARKERKVRHLAAARWFESLGDDELAGALAGHYAAAYLNAQAGAEADALAGQARIALRAAAERASNLGSHAQAVTFLMQALEVTKDEAERAALLEQAGREATDATPELARTYFDQAMVIFRSRDDLHGAGRAATGISIALHNLYRPAEAVAILEEVVALTAGMETEPDVVRLMAELARAYGNTRHPKALETADRVLELAEALDLMPIIAEALINRALVLSFAGRHYEPDAILRGVLPLTESNGLVWPQLRALNNLAAGMINDDPRTAERLIQQGIELSRRTGSLGTLVYFRGSLAETQLVLGKWVELEALIEELGGTDMADANLFEYHQTKAVFHAYRGQHAEARAIIDALQPQLAQTSLYDMVGQQEWVEARIAALAGDLDHAHRLAATGMSNPSSMPAIHCAEWATRAALWLGDEARARAAVERLDELRRPGRVIRAFKQEMRAGLHALEGRRAEALAGYRDALSAWRDLDVPLYLGLCLVDFASLVPPSEPEAAAAADEARELWSALGSAPLLARLDDAQSRWSATERERPPVASSARTPASTA
jgi:tetratricopeptide (TPR) repeat protein